MIPMLAIQLLPTLAEAIASEFIENEEILKWIASVGSLIQHGAITENELQPLVAMMERMVAEKRNPTEEEWNDIKARSDAAHEIIQNWRPSGMPT